MGFKVVIPARYGSTRLPGKPLRVLAGRPMIRHVWDRAQASAADQVVIATDDERVGDVARAFGAEVCMTGGHHRSGTDRIQEVAATLAWTDETVVVNVQGDEPLMPPALIDQVAVALTDRSQAAVATLCTPIREATELFDPHVVKVVRNARGDALLFSRAALPWDRTAFEAQPPRIEPNSGHYRHIGLYAYRVGFLGRFVSWPPCDLERIESLEQLRALWNGELVHVVDALQAPGRGVDTEADLRAVEEELDRLHI